ncbi:WD40-repeat-containing domain protein [Haematococcus lacustris]
MAQIAVDFGSSFDVIAWSLDGQYVAVGVQNAIEVWVTPPNSQASWVKECTLRGHSALVSGLSWSCSDADGESLLCSCSHDRNAFIWGRVRPSQAVPPRPNTTQVEGTAGGWWRQLVLTGLKRAALCISWAPGSTVKLAIGSGSRSVAVCTYDSSQGWWSNMAIRGQHASSVTCLAWHPAAAAAPATLLPCQQPHLGPPPALTASHPQLRAAGYGPRGSSLAGVPPGSQLLATGSTDGCIRLFTAHCQDVDGPTPVSSADGAPLLPGLRLASFGQLLACIQPPAGGWVHAVAWSPSGHQLLAVTHSSQLHAWQLKNLLAGQPAPSPSPTVPRPPMPVQLLPRTGEPRAGHGEAEGAGAGWQGVLPPPPPAPCRPCQTLQLPGCPARQLLPITDSLLLAAGWDGLLLVLATAEEPCTSASSSSCLLPGLPAAHSPLAAELHSWQCQREVAAGHGSDNTDVLGQQGRGEQQLRGLMPARALSASEFTQLRDDASAKPALQQEWQQAPGLGPSSQAELCARVGTRREQGELLAAPEWRLVDVLGLPSTREGEGPCAQRPEDPLTGQASRDLQAWSKFMKGVTPAHSNCVTGLVLHTPQASEAGQHASALVSSCGLDGKLVCWLIDSYGV